MGVVYSCFYIVCIIMKHPRIYVLVIVDPLHFLNMYIVHPLAFLLLKESGTFEDGNFLKITEVSYPLS